MRDFVFPRFVQLRDDTSRSIYDTKSADELKREFAGADFVIESTPTKQTVSDLLQSTIPELAQYLVTQGPVMTPESRFFSHLCRRIRRQFAFEKQVEKPPPKRRPNL